MSQSNNESNEQKDIRKLLEEQNRLLSEANEKAEKTRMDAKRTKMGCTAAVCFVPPFFFRLIAPDSPDAKMWSLWSLIVGVVLVIIINNREIQDIRRSDIRVNGKEGHFP